MKVLAIIFMIHCPYSSHFPVKCGGVNQFFIIFEHIHDYILLTNIKLQTFLIIPITHLSVLDIMQLFMQMTDFIPYHFVLGCY